MSRLAIRAAVAAFSLPLAALPAQAAVDAPAPEVTFASTLNAPAAITTLADLRGSAVLVEFWATWCAPCRAVMPKVKAWHEHYHDRGLVIVGIPINEAEAVVAPFVTKNEIQHVIGFAPGAMKAWGVRGVPHSFLIDPDGTIVWAGHPQTLPDAAIEDAVRTARPFVAPLTGQLEPVQQLLNADKLGRAQAMLTTMLQSGKLEPTAKEAAEATIARLDAHVERLLAGSAQQRAAEHWFAAALPLLGAAPRFAGHPHGKALEDAVALIAATEAGQRAVAQGRQLLAADALLAAGDLDGAEKGYASLAKTDDATVKEAADRGQRRVAARRAPK
ncbi:MAG: TlpA family protein disulfide reductase [Planctomycetes bacterium]|nr:TlpA family protein disulfide reductase [Planctomycetota bacterium]MCB9885474.1 TlpA family protein disulfide reductase [Planctomycetota bacterium]